ncbi:MAG: nucleotidyltransferase domain-containing protein [Candidatus Korarchaeota archaeon]|nr:nucleotidyltransferase domain-containing protein [Candidatus Korarchaeota archaeon]
MSIEKIVIELRRVLSVEDNVIYAILFGSVVEGRMREDSDMDVAIKFFIRPEPLELGRLSSLMESAVGRPVHIVDVDTAPPPLRYEIFRTGITILVRDETLMAEDKARAIMEYLDSKPYYERMVKGMIRAMMNA